jgi:hypothetical protein
MRSSGFLRDFFGISLVFLPDFFGNPSGVTEGFSLISRRTPEELANKTGLKHE